MLKKLTNNLWKIKSKVSSQASRNAISRHASHTIFSHPKSSKLPQSPAYVQITNRFLCTTKLQIKLFEQKHEKSLAEIIAQSTVNDKLLTNSNLNNERFGPELYVLEEIKRLTESPEWKLKSDFKDVIFVCGQHLLSTTISLMEFLIKLGANPQNILVVGKSYSNNKEVAERLEKLGIYVQPTSEQSTFGGFEDAYHDDIGELWRKCYDVMRRKREANESIRGIIILDDGGHVSKHIPGIVRKFRIKDPAKNATSDSIKVVCIEQTSSGIKYTDQVPWPVIQVAGSALKKFTEPSEVARKCVEETIKGIKRACDKNNLKAPKKIGIIGLGSIGAAILEEFKKNNYKTFIVYDKQESKRNEIQQRYKNDNNVAVLALDSTNIESDSAASNAEDQQKTQIAIVDQVSPILHECDVIIGCTGRDIFSMDEMESSFKTIGSPKILVSVSSKDNEFLSLLKQIQKSRKTLQIDPLEDIYYKNGFGAPIVILRGGTPIGFTNELHSVPPRLIEPIRGLKAFACLQALDMLTRKHTTPESYMVNPEWQKFIITKWLGSEPPIEKNLKDLLAKLNDVDELKKFSSGIEYKILENSDQLTNSNPKPK